MKCSRPDPPSREVDFVQQANEERRRRDLSRDRDLAQRKAEAKQRAAWTPSRQGRVHVTTNRPLRG